jgi:hypothetical protein
MPKTLLYMLKADLLATAGERLMEGKRKGAELFS